MVYYKPLYLLTVVCVVGLSACGGMSNRSMAELPVYPAPTKVTSSVPEAEVQLWEEPMVEIVDIPPGLDPEGHYYRPKHRQAVEVRQGYWRNTGPQ